MTAPPSHVINGLRLPATLIAAMEDGRWRSPPHAVFQAVFPAEHLERPTLFSLNALPRENVGWLDDRMCATFLANEAGDWRPGLGRPPKILNIGALGTDQPIALDFKGDSANPRVIYLTGSRVLRWRVVAQDLAAFMILMGL